MMVVGADATFIRDCFIETFIDKDCHCYKTHIQKYNAGSSYYEGYLWECMKKTQRVSMKFAVEFLQSLSTKFYVFWDNNVYARSYQRYPQNSILQLTGDELDSLIPSLPEDCYFFDDSMLWAIALTHEDVKPGKRYVLYVET